jgi:hypothetical protein
MKEANDKIFVLLPTAFRVKQNNNHKFHNMYVITIAVLNVFSYGSLYNFILLVLSIFIARGVSFMRQIYRISHSTYLANQSFLALITF